MKRTRIFLPAILWLYKSWLKLEERLKRLWQPAEQRVFYLAANRYFVHFLLAVIALFSFLSVNQALAQADRPIGEDTLLFQSFKDTEDVAFQESGLPKVLEGGDQFFLDLPPEELEPDFSTVAQGQAVAGISPSPLGAPATRTGLEDYYVEFGDTLSMIAEKFGVSINTLLWENKLNVYSVLRPGQKLVILPVSGVAHRVKKNETVSQLAKTYGVNADEILDFNGLKENEKLKPGQIVMVPGGTPYAPPTPKVSVPKPVVVPTPYAGPIPSEGFLWPSGSYRLSQYFSWRHPGVDIAGAKGTPIYAAQEGTIILIEKKRTGYGWQIMIDHGNGYKTRYGHTSQIFVSMGQHVAKGELIAAEGSTGRSTGPHLHFELYAYGKRVNPLSYLKR